MFTVETGLIRKIPIVEHSSIKENELAAILLTTWSRYKMEPQVTERWVQQTCNYLATIRELLGSNDTSVAVFVVRGLVSEARHLEEDALLRLIDEVIERKQLGAVLNVLNLKAETGRTSKDILNALGKGLIVEFNSKELNALQLREREVRDVGSLMLLTGVSDDAVIDEEELESTLRGWAERNVPWYKEEMTFDKDSLKELLHTTCKLTQLHIKNMSEEQQNLLRSHTSMGTLTEVIAKIKLRKEILFDESEMQEDEPQVQTYPSLTMEGVAIGKAIAYTLGRIPLEQRKEMLLKRLIEIQKDRSILLFSKPGEYDITTAECTRLSDFASRFLFDLISRLETNDAQSYIISLVERLGLLEQK